MKKITCDTTITVDDKPYTVGDLAAGLALTDKRFASSASGLFAGARLVKFAGASQFEIESTDYELLAAAARAPEPGYPIRPALLCAPLVQAILDATAL